MSITTLDEKFIHDLGDIYDAEHRFLEAQQELRKHAGAKKLQSMLEEHMQQTELHIRNLEQVYELVGERAKRIKCDAAAGLVHEGQKGLKEAAPQSAICDAMIAGAAAKVEHYEIAAYRGLIMLCNELGYAPAADILRKNLQQEEATAQKIEQTTPELLAKIMISPQYTR
jgi:ferritin-like metal-binding protein YciE